eukprot:scaffold1950_cov44-Prasinocladus_malaysianus.AAC.1
MALTATATERVCADLQEILHISHCEVFKRSINRPNLFYQAAEKPATAAAQQQLVIDWIHKYYPDNESGIIYCLTQKDTEAMAAALSLNGIIFQSRGIVSQYERTDTVWRGAAGISAEFYHANMDPTHREQVHLEWNRGSLQVLAATVAFGMGINKPDVRFVIHETMSKSLENYYQESGRAGRDGKPSRCLLLYKFSDIPRQCHAMRCDVKRCNLV